MAKLVQVELWSDYAAAGGFRERVIPIEEVFGATLDTDTLGKSDLALTVNARIAELFGGTISAATSGVINLSTGLVMWDDFDRPDSGTVGAPPGFAAWTESTPSIVSQRLNRAAFASFNKCFRATPAPLQSFVISGNMITATSREAGVIHNLVTAGPDGADTAYYRLGSTSTGTDRLRFVKVAGGLVVFDSDVSGIIPTALHASPVCIRHVHLDDGVGTVTLRHHFNAGALAGNEVASITFKHGADFVDSPGLGFNDYGVHFGRNRQFELFWLAGKAAADVDIDVTGLPTGHKIRIDGGTPVVESGGSASIDPMGGAAGPSITLPYTLLEILDPADAVVGSVTPTPPGTGFPAGGFPGDSYTVVSLAVPEGFVPGAERKIIRSIFDDGLTLEHRLA